MPELKVKISTVGELSGAKAVEAQLERQIGQFKALGKSTDELEAKLANTRKQIAEFGESNAEAMKRVEGAGDAVEAAAKKKSYLGMSLRDLRKSLRELSQEVPGLGVALQALKNPVMGLVMVVAGAVAALIKLWKSNTTAAQEAAVKFEEALNKQADSAIKAQTGLAEYNAKLARMSSESQSVASNLQKMNAELDRQLSVEERMDNLRKEAELAEARSTIKDARTLAKREYEIEEKYLQRREERQKEAADRKVQNQKDAIKEAEETIAKLKAQLEPKAKTEADAQAMVASIEEQLKADEKEAEELAKKVAKKWESYEYRRSQLGWLGGDSLYTGAPKVEALELEKQQAALEARIQGRRKDLVRARYKAALATSELNTVKSGLETSMKDKSILTGSLPTVESEASALKHGIAVEGSLTRQIGMAHLKSKLAAAAEHEEKERRGQIESSAREAEKLFRDVVSGAGGSIHYSNKDALTDALARLIQAVRAKEENQAKLIDDFVRELNEMKTRERVNR